MRLNDIDLIDLVQRRKAELEGRLQHRSPHKSKGFRERFFKLVGNLLFYYRISELSQIEDEPMGVMVLENYSVHLLESKPNLTFAFELIFHDEPEKRHIFTTRTERDMNHWVKTLQTSSFQYWKEKYETLSLQLNITNEKSCNLEKPGTTFRTLDGNRNQRHNPFLPPRPTTVTATTVQLHEEDLITF